MRILITNDDGILAPGLAVLEEIANKIAGPDGEVWVVAPSTEKSGVGHCINYTTPTLLHEHGDRRFSVEGNPADAVLAGIYDVIDTGRPDLVLSGVNRGNNAGENVLYSGTIGAAMEGALQDIPSIALSQFYGFELAGVENMFEAAATYGEAVVRDLLDKGVWETSGYQVFYNVNFPPVLAADVRGVRMTHQGWRPTSRHKVQGENSPSGRRYLWVTGGSQTEDTGPGSDVAANVAGHIAITPLRADLTARDLLTGLSGFDADFDAP